MGFLGTVLKLFFLGAVLVLISGSKDSPQQPPPRPPPPQERPPQRPHKPYRPPKPQGEQPPQSYPPSTSPPKQHKPDSPRQSKKHHSDLNRTFKDDPYYVSLRARASDEGDKMTNRFQESQYAYASGDRAKAKTLSIEGKEHKKRMERFHAEASAWIYAKNNEDSGPGEIDLHGLYVNEAIHYTTEAIEGAKRRGDTTINIIVGKGLHSSDGVAKIKPAIEALIKKRNLVAELDPDNSGVLIVQLVRRKSSRRAIGVDGVTRRLEKSQGYLIM